ncbi:MAG: 50S ribosomal protein L4 [Prevotellaceae bacterium]|jgi:large subunit ribosomal protein L4|nr:50S ribosomal protein L4 [Prevotellaceae bacterium]
MELAIYDINGEKTAKTATLDNAIFGIEPNSHAIYLDVKQYLANQRQGTHKTKERWEVAYSTKKMGRQKGGGGARHGSIKANIYVGGGRTFGPKPRDYRFKLNKKVKRLARMSAFAYKAQKDSITIVENINFEVPKTKDFIKLSNNLKFDNQKTLMILSEPNKNLFLSARNLAKVKVTTVSELSTYDIMNASKLVLLETTVDALHKTFGIE